MMLFFLTTNINRGQAQPFANPTLQEATYTTPTNIWDGLCDQPANANTNTYGDLTYPSYPYHFDLYVSTWDPSPGIIGNSGILVGQKNHLPNPLPVTGLGLGYGFSFPPAPIDGNMGNPFINVNMKSMEAGILKTGNHIIIALTYFMPTSFYPTITGDYYLMLFEWIPTTAPHLIPFPGTKPYVLSDGLGNVSPGWIHQDVNGLNKIIITWEDDDAIFTRAGEITAYPPNVIKLGTTKQLAVNDSCIHPDVAMLKTTTGDINLYYVMTSSDSTELKVYRSDFNTIFSSPTYDYMPPDVGPLPYSGITLAPILLYNNSFGGKFGLPRIETPDNAQNPNMADRWAVTVASHTTNNDYIYGITYDGIIPAVYAQILNDGSLIPGGDISLIPSDGGYNRRPTVAFSNNGSDVFYAWTFHTTNPSFIADLNGENFAYLSLKTTFDLSLINGFSPPRYFKVSNVNATPPPTTDYYHINCAPSVALTTQNDASPFMYAFYLLRDQPGMSTTYRLGYKTTNWNTNIGFRPSGVTKIKSLDAKQSSFSVYPSPFRQTFQIELKGEKKVIRSIIITNLFGQTVFSSKGNIVKINKELRKIGVKLANGQYIVKIQTPSGKTYSKMVVKL